MKRVIVSVALLFVLLLVGVALWAYSAFLYTKPLSQAELAELTPDWSLVTHGNWSPWFTQDDGTVIWNPAASFNAWLATVPEDDKAWPVLVDVYYRNQALFDQPELQRMVDDVEDWSSVSALLATDQSKDAIDAIIDALGRDVMGCGLYESTDPYEHRAILGIGLVDESWQEIPTPNPGLMTLFPPAQSVHSKSVRLVLLSAASELVQGNPDAFVSMTTTALGAWALSCEHPTLVSQLVSLSVINSSHRAISWAIENHWDQLTESHLLALDAAIGRAQSREFLWQGEALAFHDMIRRMASPQGSLSLKSAPSWGGGNGAIDDPTHLTDQNLHQSVTRIFVVYNQLLETTARQSQIPWDGSWNGINQLHEQSKDKLSLTGALLIETVLPALDKTALFFRESAQSRIALRLAIAARRHAIVHDSFPASIDAINPDLLAFEPMDIFTGKQLHYTLIDRAPLIYATGPDRDDDAGEHVFGIARSSPKTDGDWILYPPQRTEDD